MTFFLSANVACDVARNVKVLLKIPSVWDPVITPAGWEDGEENGYGCDHFMMPLITISSANISLAPVANVGFSAGASPFLVTFGPVMSSRSAAPTFIQSPK